MGWFFLTQSRVWICAGEHVSKKTMFRDFRFRVCIKHMNRNQAEPKMVVDQPSKVDQASTIPGNVSIDDH